MDIKAYINEGKAILGIEFGSTRIKAVLIDDGGQVLCTGGFNWENSLENGIWTYSIEEIYEGLRESYSSLKEQVKKDYGVTVKNLRAIGISGMMHGFLPFNKEMELLTPFRTWRNTNTLKASNKLTDAMNFNIPQRWSVAHLYEAILNDESYIKDISYITTLSGFVHYLLTNEKVLGIGDASGMFPVKDNNYDEEKINIFNSLIKNKVPWKIQDILPKVLCAGEYAGVLTEKGARLLDFQGDLLPNIPLCPPEGDAGTGMTATNSVRKRTGNVSAGTSVFAMVVLERALKKPHREIDMVTTPDGTPVAMVHCNNCTSDINSWVALFKEVAELYNIDVKTSDLFTRLFNKSMEADKDNGGLLSYNYFSGEHITGFSTGMPLFLKYPGSNFNLANFMRTQIFTCFGALKIGLEILETEEKVLIDKILGHGGLFKTPKVGQMVLASVVKSPVSLMETAGEGGAWGIALLASFLVNKNKDESLSQYLDSRIFAKLKTTTLEPSKELTKSFDDFMVLYKKGLIVEKTATEI